MCEVASELSCSEPLTPTQTRFDSHVYAIKNGFARISIEKITFYKFCKQSTRREPGLCARIGRASSSPLEPQNRRLTFHDSRTRPLEPRGTREAEV